MSKRAMSAAERLKAALGDKVLDIVQDGRGVVVRLPVEAVPDALTALQEDQATPFNMLVTITAVDWSTWSKETGQPEKPARFSLTYNLYSISSQTRLFLETFIKDGQSVPTAACHYASADWAEREVYDMFGIRFSGHPDLRRIYLTDDFAGHPLRKDFPTAGHEPQDFPQE